MCESIRFIKNISSTIQVIIIYLAKFTCPKKQGHICVSVYEYVFKGVHPIDSKQWNWYLHPNQQYRDV